MRSRACPAPVRRLFLPGGFAAASAFSFPSFLPYRCTQARRQRAGGWPGPADNGRFFLAVPDGRGHKACKKPSQSAGNQLDISKYIVEFGVGRPDR